MATPADLQQRRSSRGGGSSSNERAASPRASPTQLRGTAVVKNQTRITRSNEVVHREMAWMMALLLFCNILVLWLRQFASVMMIALPQQSLAGAESRRLAAATTPQPPNVQAQLREEPAVNSNTEAVPKQIHDEDKNAKEVQSAQQPQPEANHDNDRFLVFDIHLLTSLNGQGAGNLMNGLLATHLLADEFGRTACIANSSDSFASFLEHAFEPVHPARYRACQQAAAAMYVGSGGRKRRHPQDKSSIVKLVNFADPPVNECQARNVLESERSVVFVVANTYPRWSEIPQQDYFAQFYRPTSQLKSVLPYQETPETVVHLRTPDNPEVDDRPGLDDLTFQALAAALPQDTYLVTNRVDWLQDFSTKYGWRSANWKQEIVHSGKEITWGKDGRRQDVDTYDKTLQHLQLWADWYTIAQAKRLYHTFSDFSMSAVHWNDIANAHVLHGGLSQAQLRRYSSSMLLSKLTQPEPWRVDGATVPLAERTGSGGDDKHSLLHCGEAKPTIDPVERRFQQLRGTAGDGSAKKKFKIKAGGTRFSAARQRKLGP